LAVYSLNINVPVRTPASGTTIIKGFSNFEGCVKSFFCCIFTNESWESRETHRISRRTGISYTQLLYAYCGFILSKIIVDINPNVMYDDFRSIDVYTAKDENKYREGPFK